MPEPEEYTAPPGFRIPNASGTVKLQPVLIDPAAPASEGDVITRIGSGYAPTAPGGGGGGAEQYVDFQLTDSQIRALPTVPPVVLPAPGDGLMYIFKRGVLYADLAADYADVDTNCYLVLTANGADAGVQRQHASNIIPVGNSAWFDGGNGPSLAFLTPKVSLPFEFSASYPLVEICGVPRGDWNNKPLVLAVSQAADFTGGNPGNTLSGRLWYALAPAVPFGD